MAVKSEKNILKISQRNIGEILSTVIREVGRSLDFLYLRCVKRKKKKVVKTVVVFSLS